MKSLPTTLITATLLALLISPLQADYREVVTTEGGVKRLATVPAPRAPQVNNTATPSKPAVSPMRMDTAGRYQRISAPAFTSQPYRSGPSLSERQAPSRNSHHVNRVIEMPSVIVGGAADTAIGTTERTLNGEINRAIRRTIRQNISF